jgi:hypothetical protein
MRRIAGQSRLLQKGRVGRGSCRRRLRPPILTFAFAWIYLVRLIDRFWRLSRSRDQVDASAFHFQLRSN